MGRRNRRANRRKRRARAARENGNGAGVANNATPEMERDIRSALEDDLGDASDDAQGGLGGAFKVPRMIRADSRIFANLFTLGVVSLEESQALIRRMMSLMATSNPRETASLCRCAIAAIKVELDYRLAAMKTMPIQAAMIPQTPSVASVEAARDSDERSEVDEEPIAFLYHPPHDDMVAALRVLRDTGILDSMLDGGVVDGSVVGQP